MSEVQAERAVLVGAAVAEGLADEGVTSLALGEMGIGNTATAALLAAALTGAEVTDVVGRGTGVSDAGLAHKRSIVERGLSLHGPAARGELDWLARAGGFEIAALVGAMIAGAARRLVVVVDGFIASTAALLAVRLCPASSGYLVAAHRSVEPGHRVVLDALGLRPLLDLDLRLGEGTGAALALPLLDAAVALLDEMATFASAGVAGARRG
jgi:nicotinate-nucleotide--dimethylbenzimidazole phosphoribosyltransferase